MMATTEVAKMRAMKPAAEKEKKARATKPKSAKTASHPPYFDMIKDALLTLKEKGGSSPYAISKYIKEKHKGTLPANFKKILGLQMKNCAAKGKLIKVKASYKLSESSKKKDDKVKKDASAAAKPAEKAEAAKKAKKAAGTGTPPKKPAKAKGKQPKSIKSLVKKAKKVAA